MTVVVAVRARAVAEPVRAWRASASCARLRSASHRVLRLRSLRRSWPSHRAPQDRSPTLLHSVCYAKHTSSVFRTVRSDSPPTAELIE